VVNAYNMPSPKKLFDQFPHTNKVLIEGCSPWTIVKNLIIVGGIVVAVVVLYYKFGVLKNKCTGYLFAK